MTDRAPITCVCPECAEMSTLWTGKAVRQPATQEDFLCDNCRAGTCTGKSGMLAALRATRIDR